MKNIFAITKTIFILSIFLGLNLSSFADGPPPPPGGSHGQTTNQPPNGGNAPIGGGLAILIGLGTVWGAGKFYSTRSKEQ